MNDKAKEYILAVGAMSEALGAFRDQLIKNGFTREEALALCGRYLTATLGGGKDG